MKKHHKIKCCLFSRSLEGVVANMIFVQYTVYTVCPNVDITQLLNSFTGLPQTGAENVKAFACFSTANKGGPNMLQHDSTPVQHAMLP